MKIYHSIPIINGTSWIRVEYGQKFYICKWVVVICMSQWTQLVYSFCVFSLALFYFQRYQIMFYKAVSTHFVSPSKKAAGGWVWGGAEKNNSAVSEAAKFHVPTADSPLFIIYELLLQTALRSLGSCKNVRVCKGPRREQKIKPPSILLAIQRRKQEKQQEHTPSCFLSSLEKENATFWDSTVDAL